MILIIVKFCDLFDIILFTSSLILDVDQILNAPETQDEGVWKYEHLRQFCMELNGLAVKLQVQYD